MDLVGYQLLKIYLAVSHTPLQSKMNHILVMDVTPIALAAINRVTFHFPMQQGLTLLSILLKFWQPVTLSIFISDKQKFILIKASIFIKYLRQLKCLI